MRRRSSAGAGVGGARACAVHSSVDVERIRSLARSSTRRVRSSMADTNRIMKELREIASDAASGVTVSQHGDSLTHMKGTISGARDLVVGFVSVD